MNDRRGPWVPTFSGGRWYPLDPNPEDFCLEDIAHHLSLVCRYGGATQWHYSVAEHSVALSQIVPEHMALAALLHDAGEAVIGDMVRPLKGMPGMSRFREIELLNVNAIRKRFGVHLDLADQVLLGQMDDAICVDEALALLKNGESFLHARGYDPKEKTRALIQGLSPERAEFVFCARFFEITGGLIP